MHQKPRIPPRPKEDGVSCCMMDEKTVPRTTDNRLCDPPGTHLHGIHIYAVQEAHGH